MAEIIIWKRRTNVKSLKLPYDISGDVITSQIRKGTTRHSDLIVEWNVSFRTDGKDGELILILDDADLENIPDHVGYMDVKRVTGGEPYPVLDEPIVVHFREPITETVLGTF